MIPDHRNTASIARNRTNCINNILKDSQGQSKKSLSSSSLLSSSVSSLISPLGEDDLRQCSQKSSSPSSGGSVTSSSSDSSSDAANDNAYGSVGGGGGGVRGRRGAGVCNTSSNNHPTSTKASPTAVSLTTATAAKSMKPTMISYSNDVSRLQNISNRSSVGNTGIKTKCDQPIMESTDRQQQEQQLKQQRISKRKTSFAENVIIYHDNSDDYSTKDKSQRVGFQITTKPIQSGDDFDVTKSRNFHMKRKEQQHKLMQKMQQKKLAEEKLKEKNQLIIRSNCTVPITLGGRTYVNCHDYKQFIIYTEYYRRLQQQQQRQCHQHSFRMNEIDYYHEILDTCKKRTERVTELIQCSYNAFYDYSRIIPSLLLSLEQPQTQQQSSSTKVFSSSSKLLQPIFQSLYDLNRKLNDNIPLFFNITKYMIQLQSEVKVYVTVYKKTLKSISTRLQQQQNENIELDGRDDAVDPEELNVRAAYKKLLEALDCHMKRINDNGTSPATGNDASCRATPDTVTIPATKSSKGYDRWLADASYRNAARLVLCKYLKQLRHHDGNAIVQRNEIESLFSKIIQLYDQYNDRISTIIIQFIHQRKIMMTCCSSALQAPAIESLSAPYHNVKEMNTIESMNVEQILQDLLQQKQKDQLQQQQKQKEAHAIHGSLTRTLSSYLYNDMDTSNHSSVAKVARIDFNNLETSAYVYKQTLFNIQLGQLNNVSRINNVDWMPASGVITYDAMLHIFVTPTFGKDVKTENDSLSGVPLASKMDALSKTSMNITSNKQLLRDGTVSHPDYSINLRNCQIIIPSSSNNNNIPPNAVIQTSPLLSSTDICFTQMIYNDYRGASTKQKNSFVSTDPKNRIVTLRFPNKSELKEWIVGCVKDNIIFKNVTASLAEC